MTEKSRGTGSLEDALRELTTRVPDAELLEETVRRYPHFAGELTDRAVEMVLDAIVTAPEARPEESQAELDTMVLRAMSRFHNLLHAAKAQEQAVADATSDLPPSPFAGLAPAEVRGLAKHLRCGTAFLMKLRDRLIQPQTIPGAFLQNLAQGLNESVERVAAYLAGPPLANAQTSYKADQKPEATAQQTYEEAVRSSGLGDDQQQFLLGL